MKIVECRGTHKKIGETIGESLREEIHKHITLCVRSGANHGKIINSFITSSKRYIPQVLEQLRGIAWGANVSEEKIFALNIIEGTGGYFQEECSNVIFRSGPDGPLWGKNNDGISASTEERRPVCILKIYPNDGIPSLCFTFCGWLSGGDMMNAEGVAVGHSSVGSKFLQSLRHVSVLHWLYAGMLKVRTALEFSQHITSLPLMGKGFSQVTIDQNGHMFSAEIACPLVQIRIPEPNVLGMNCVNCFQLPLLKDVTNRTPEQLENALGRKKFLESVITKGSRSINYIKKILQHHGKYSICRHGGNKDEVYTEYSIIGLVKERKILFTEGYPCKNKYQEVTL